VLSGSRSAISQPAPAQGGGERAREHGAEAAADRDDRGDRADGRRQAVRRELVADDAEGEREHRPAEALDDPAGDEDADGGRDGRDHAAERDRQQREDEDPALADQVADAAEQGRGDGGGDQPGGHGPGDAGGGGVEVLLDDRQDRDDERLERREGGHAQRQDGEGGGWTGSRHGVRSSVSRRKADVWATG
jgi:hypothetical protein